MLLEIAQYGNPVLKEKCRPVEHFDDGLKALAENMLETMYAAEGTPGGSAGEHSHSTGGD